jgi:hypothetical protein
MVKKDWKPAGTSAGNARLVPQKRVIDARKAAMRRIANQLHEVYKKYKAGIIKEEQLTSEQKRLLRKYYGV